ncbi:hypothetical protein M514_04593 [Trichuris suis]|uniref:S1 motif domain-containing protein n=1 Tax=Trichuris suis TaxID=68888 RepID=A0A085NV13_9BILA|nr:hypothetical protein M514_04593 [Trichuris suis]
MFDGDFLTSEEFPTAESVRDAVGALIRQTLLAKPSIKDLLDRIEYCWVLYDVSLYYRRRDANRVFVTVNANASTRRLAKQKKAQSSSVSTAEGTSAEREYLNFSHYFNFRSSIASLRPHQVMAINRGVKRKVLKKQFTVPQSWLSEFLAATAKLMGKSGCNEAKAFVANCTKTCYTKVVRPRLVSRLWNKASKLARIHAVECFATNLESLLLTAPVKGHSIIGVDPGFTNGCKYAMISAQGDILATGIFYLPQVNNSRFHVAISEFCDFAVCHRCDRIAIGNGKGSKETVAYLKCLIREKRFKDLDIRWRVVNETGSSVYSISSSAELEMPELSPNLRSAVSIARRVLDPLSEYIKIGPASLSVGMYQHDIPSSVLKTTVDMVVEQCVSFVGVDVNTCSVDLLEHVTGLNKKTAKAICEFRQKNGPFVCRYQLKCVKGVSEHAFQMCSGFVRIHGKHDDSSAAWRPNPLDATSIHPESYPIVESLLVAKRMHLMDLYDEQCRRSFVQWLSEPNDEKISLVSKCNCSISASLQFIAESLQNYGVSSVFSCSSFDLQPSADVGTIGELQRGTVLQGTVKNVTSFGVFVDVGVGRDGLIPTRLLPTAVSLRVGNEVRVSVRQVDVVKNRFDLCLIECI